MNKFEDIPTKDRKATPLDAQFKRPIIVVDRDRGVIGGIGMEQHWVEENTRNKVTPAPPILVPEFKPERKRKKGGIDPAEVRAAWEESGHNQAKAARIMRVQPSTFQNWYIRYLKEGDGDGGHNQC